MTRQGKYNILGIVLLPLAACAGGGFASLNGVWKPYFETFAFLFQLNLIFMLVVGLLSSLLLLWSKGELARWVAITPTWVTSGIGAVWYIGRGIFPAAVAPGAEYIGALQYLLIFALVSVFVVLVLRFTGIVKRTA